MLEQLTIRDYALIENLNIEFGKGLNILSGETGAGKSILIGALGLILGEKGQGDAIREGCDEALVSGTILVEPTSELLSFLGEKGISLEDDTILIRRNLKRSGRGAITVNSVPLSRTELEELSEQIFDLHSQHEHQSLLRSGFQRKLLDKYAGIINDVEALTEKFYLLSDSRKELSKMLEAETDKEREAELLRYAINEIEAAKLKPGEIENLEKSVSLLAQSEKLAEFVEGFISLVSENRNGVLSDLRLAKKHLDDLCQIDNSFTSIQKQMEDAFYEIEDVNNTIKDYRSRIEFSPEELDTMQERLALIHRLQKKYGEEIEEIERYAEDAARKLSTLENFDEEKTNLSHKIKELEKQVLNEAAIISQKRKKAAEQLQKQLEDILSSLGLEKSRLIINVSQAESKEGKPVCKSFGFDKIEFLFSANEGVSPKSLSNVASGGELSRVMLAIKTVFANYDDISVLVFDEIDSGIGGEVAISVGKHLQDLGEKKQILCITHLASIASRGDKHLKVEKFSTDNGTRTKVIELNNSERIDEVARMLAGDSHTDISQVHAKELLERHSRKH